MDGWIAIGAKLDTKSFDKQIKSLERELNDIESSLEMAGEDKSLFSTTEIESMEKEAEKLRNKLIDLKEKQNELDRQGMPNISQITSDISSKTENVIKKVAKWALAVFSVRSAYFFIRQSVSTLSQYNEKLATDIEYIRYAIASSLQPLIEGLIRLAYKLLAYLNVIFKGWFGKPLFEKAGLDKFNKGLGTANKSAKELQKTLAGFDEMNILNESGGTSVGGGGGGIPSMDLPQTLPEGEVPSWIQWIADNGRTVATILGAIGAAIIAMKITEFAGGLMGVTEGLMNFKVGAGLLVGGLVLLGVEIANLIINWNDMTTAQKETAVEIASFGGVLVALGLVISGIVTGPIGLLIAALSLIAGGIAKAIIKSSEEESAMESNKNATILLTDAKNNLANAEKEFVNAQSKYKTAVENRETALKELQKIEAKSKQSGEELYKSVMTGKLKYEDMTDQLTRDTYLAYVKYKGTITDVDKATQDLQDEEHELILASLDEQAAIAATSQDFEALSETINNLVDKGTISAEEGYAIIEKMFKSMDGLGKDVFNIQFPKYFTSSTNSAETLRKKVQELYNQYKKLKDLGFPSTSGNYYSSRTLWAKGGVLTYAKGGIYKPLKLASGAVVNQPSRGVPIAPRAIAGEHGAEGIVPLTDSQQMSLLGAAIGKYVTIAATVPVYIGNRQVTREMRRIEAEDTFAYNG